MISLFKFLHENKISKDRKRLRNYFFDIILSYYVFHGRVTLFFANNF